MSPLLADIVAKVENRTTLKISRKLIFGLLCCCVAFQRNYGDPRSILGETIRSLTSPRVRRISGSKNFRSPPQKDFCNNICQEQTRLLRWLWQGRGMMVDDQPTLAVLYVGEAISSRQALGLAILDVGERVIAGIYRCVPVHADQLIAEGDLETGQNLE